MSKTLETRTVEATSVQQVIKEYIHFECPFCKRVCVCIVEDDDSEIIHSCEHLGDFEYAYEMHNDVWTAVFTKEHK